MTSSKENYILNHAEFIVLGLIDEEPSYAYKINEKIKERGMREWTSIGRSSIYRVIKDLEDYGYANRWIEEVDNRVQKVYEITEKGHQILKKQVYNTIREYYGRNDEEFYVAFSMLPILNKKQQIQSISLSIDKINNHISDLKKMLKENSKMPINVRGLFIHPIKVLQADLDFLGWALKEVKEGRGQVSLEDYMKIK
ncbi:MAG: PadR family transcriptional regulator [Candidatus Lokiarchaeota archaeon]